MHGESVITIEQAALNAWPSPRQMVYDGWLLRFAGGASKRVNSVNPIYPASLPLEEKITTCEAVYHSQEQPCLFRMTDLNPNPGLQQALEAAGFSPFDTTLVLGRKLELQESPYPEVTVLDMPMADWFDLRDHFLQVSPTERQIHQSILDSIVPEKVLVGLFSEGKPAACGMGVVEGALLGFFSIYTAASWRRKGYGSLIMGALTDWGMARGAVYGYLQVEADNRPALALYKKLGYQQVYAYEYYRKL